jgi:lactoylglutathione lyase
LRYFRERFAGLTPFLGISVDNLEAACARLEGLNVNWKKRLTDGRMKNVAFVLDPDGYWVEIVQNERFTGKANF